MIVTFTPVNIGGPDPALFGRSAGTIVGGEDALAVADEDTAYVEVESPGIGIATFTLVPDKMPPPVDQLIQVWWAAQFRLMEPPSFPSSRDYVVSFKTEEFGVANFETEDPPTHSTEWVTVESSRYPLGYGEVAEELYTAWVLDPTTVGAVDSAQLTQVSWLRFYAEFADTGRPLRWRQRNDGLGGSSPKAARGVTSQQGSNRHRGYV